MSSEIKIKKSILYILVFLFTLHTTPALYINSIFLEQFMARSRIGFVFIAISILIIIGFTFMPVILKKFGNYRTFLSIIFIETICLIMLAFISTPWILILAFILSITLQTLALFNFDIFLEHNSQHSTTGGTRALFLMSISLAILIGPFIASFVLIDNGFSTIFLISAVLMLPVFYMSIKYLNNFKDDKYHNLHIWQTIRTIIKNSDLHNIIAANFLLNIFYSWVIIYVPLYLHEEIGLSLSETTIVIGIGLLPFILFDVLWGWLADKKIGEKEILTAGFIIIAASTAAISFIEVDFIIVWAGILFVTRIGASMIETMVETYTFKKIEEEDTDILSFFRVMAPIAYIIGPILASVLLINIDFKYIFVILGAIMLYGIRYSLAIKDTL